MKGFSVLSLLSMAFVFLAGQAVLAVPAKEVSNNANFLLNSNWDFGGKVYYRCDTVEYTAKTILEKMGARNVQVHCNGGINDVTPPISWDATVQASYDSLQSASATDPQVVQAEYSSVVLRDFNNCFLATQLFNKFKGNFSVQNLKESQCMNPDSNYSINFDVLK